MAGGLAVGGFAQGLAQGLQTGVGIYTQADRNARESERFALERPALQAAAEKGKQELAFQQDYAERLKGLYKEAEGGEVVAEDGTVTKKPPMSSVEMEVRSADLMKQSMVKAGLMDFKRLTEARQYSKMIEEEGVLEAMDYAIKNPNDQAGIKERFNAAGKVKLGDDVSIGIETGEFGSKVVGTRVGANGKVEKVFDGADLLRPYISASTYATLQNQKDIAAGREKGDDRRSAAGIGAQLQLGRMREDSARRNLEYQQGREDRRAEAALDQGAVKDVMDLTKTNITSITRNMGIKEDSWYATAIQNEIGGFAADLVQDKSSPFYRRPQQAFDAAYKRVAQEYNINVTNPTFAPVTPAKPKK